MHNIPIVIIIIRNKAGSYFMHQRSSDKKMFPNLYGIGAGGHIEKDESPDTAAARELREETGLQTPIRYLFDHLYADGSIHLTISVFETHAENVSPSDAEWQWSGWLTQAQVDNLITDKKLCPDTEQIYVKYRSGSFS